MTRGNRNQGVDKPRLKSRPWPLIIIFLLLIAAIIVPGVFYYQKQKKDVFSGQISQLKAIADLKAGEISKWLVERTADTRLITQDRDRTALLSALLRDRSNAPGRESVKRWLSSLQNLYHYENVMLIDRQGDVVLAANSDHTEVSGEGLKSIEDARRLRDVVLSDLHSSPTVPHIHLDLIAPLVSGEEIAGFVVLRIDPNDFLFSMIQSWPTPSPSAETLLVRREGDHVLFLNELRHRKDTAMKLRIPVSTDSLPAARAVLGKADVFTGSDYRGVAVWSVSRPVQGTSWFMVAKVDRDEIELPLRRSILAIFLVTLSLIMAAAMLILHLWQRQNTRFRLRQLDAESKKRALEQHFDYLTRYANDIILLSDEKWQILEANERALLAYGRKREDLLKMNLRDLRVPGERSKFAAEYKQTEEKLGAIFETWHMKQDGSIFPVEVSARVITVDGKKYYQSIIRDISERRQAEMELRESEDKFKYVFEAANVGKSITLPTGEISVNQAFCAMLGYTPAELKNKTWQELTPPAEIATVQKILGPLLKGEKDSVHFEKRYIHRNGSVVWGDVSTVMRRDPVGKPLHFITTVVDITERKQNEEQIEKHIEELQRWQDVMLDRADRVRELKDEVNELCRRAGMAARYSSQIADPTAPGSAAEPDAE